MRRSRLRSSEWWGGGQRALSVAVRFRDRCRTRHWRGRDVVLDAPRHRGPSARVKSELSRIFPETRVATDPMGLSGGRVRVGDRRKSPDGARRSLGWAPGGPRARGPLTKSTGEDHFPHNTSAPRADESCEAPPFSSMTPFLRGHMTDVPLAPETLATLSPGPAWRRERRHRRHGARGFSVLLTPLVLLAACSGRPSGDAAARALPPACTAFVAKYEACIKTSVPSLPGVAQERAAQTRSSLELEAERAGASTSTAAQDLAALEARCEDNLRRLSLSCTPSRMN